MAKRKAATKKSLAEIELPDQLTIEAIEDVIIKFREKASQANNITLKSTKPIKNIDMAGLQGILFMKKFASENKKQLDLSVNLDETVEDLLQNTGFKELM